MKALLINNIICLPNSLQPVDETLLTFFDNQAKPTMHALSILKTGRAIQRTHHTGKTVSIKVIF